MDKLNILISCSGKQLPLIESFKSSLKGLGKLIVSDINPYSAGKTIADIVVESPPITSDNYASWCLKTCKEYKVSLWISFLESEILLLESIRLELESEGCILMGAPQKIINCALDKLSYQSLLANTNIKTPNTYSLDTLKAYKDYKNIPYIIKPRQGRGSRGIFRVDSLQELLSYAQKENFSSDIVFQPVLDGQQYCIDVINDLDRKFSTVLIRKRYVMGQYETDVAETVHCERILKLAEELSKVTQHQGCIDVELIEKQGQFYLIDLNMRFGGSHIFSLMAGANISKAIIAWRQGFEANAEDLKHRNNEIFTRFSSVARLNSR